MIAASFVENWRSNVDWKTLPMVEQDLVISRALVCLYNNPKIKDSLIFRGGTALNKLYIKPPARYSEDLDFVQRQPEPIGETIDLIRDLLRDWLGEPKRKISELGAKMIYKYESIDGLPARLKIEINTIEHFQVLPIKQEPFMVNSEWFKGHCEIATYSLEELIATKLKALYQRRKGRDLFDLWLVFESNRVNADQVIEIFQTYCANEGTTISKELFQKNLEVKKLNKDFQMDMYVLLPTKAQWDFDNAYEFVQDRIISKLP